MNNNRRYKHLFFDLDRTLWDLEKNSAETIMEIVDEFKLSKYNIDRDLFLKSYIKHNDALWEQYQENKITKAKLRTERFKLTLNDFDISDEQLTQDIDEYYIEKSPEKAQLISGAREILEYLSDNFKLYIVSNGFYETQLRKLEAADIKKYFIKVFTSERVGAAKPNRLFFEYALNSSNARKNESLVIGDDYKNDIAGAMNYGVDQIWLNPENIKANIEPTFTISSLSEIKNIL